MRARFLYVSHGKDEKWPCIFLRVDSYRIERSEKSMSDWTKELFAKHPELFVGALEERVAQASREVDALIRMLREQKFKTENILDLNCGIGRHSVELGKRGTSVLGTDLSPHFIEIAKKRAEKEKVADMVRFKVADMREIASAVSDEEPFDGIINLFTSFGFYDDETNDDILRQCCQLVQSEGFFALEIANRDWIIKSFQERGFSRYKNVTVLQERSFDPNTSRMINVWTYLMQQDDKNFTLEKQITVNHRLWSLHELVEMFERTGWQFNAAYSDFAQQQEDIPLVRARRFLFIGKKR